MKQIIIGNLDDREYKELVDLLAMRETAKAHGWATLEVVIRGGEVFEQSIRLATRYLTDEKK